MARIWLTFKDRKGCDRVSCITQCSRACMSLKLKEWLRGRPTLPVRKWSHETCYSSRCQKKKKWSLSFRIPVPKAEQTQSAPSVTVMGAVECCALFWAMRFRRNREQLERTTVWKGRKPVETQREEKAEGKHRESQRRRTPTDPHTDTS